MRNVIKDAATLAAITLVSGVLLSYVYTTTTEPIRVRNEAAQTAAYQEVFRDASTFESVLEGSDKKLQDYLIEEGLAYQVVDDAAEALDQNGAALGYVFTVTTKDGYSGDIVLVMGVRMDGTLNGISILTITETAGLGMKADTDVFIDQFREINVSEFKSTKSQPALDGQIDTISGATITTDAVVNGVNAGLRAFTYMEGGDS